MAERFARALLRELLMPIAIPYRRPGPWSRRATLPALLTVWTTAAAAAFTAQRQAIRRRYPGDRP